MRKTKTTAAPKADPQNKELVEAIRALCQEKDLSEDMLFATVEDALKNATNKDRKVINLLDVLGDKAKQNPPPTTFPRPLTARRVKFMCIPAA